MLTKLVEKGTPSWRLTDRERKFCHEYVVDYNKKRAAITAGYSKKCANTTAYKLLRKPHVARYIGLLEARVIAALDITHQEIMYQLWCIGTLDAGEVYDENGILNVNNLNNLSPKARNCISGIKQKVFYDREGNVSNVETDLKFSSKLSALDMALKVRGDYAPEKHEVDDRGSFDWNALKRDPKVIEVENKNNKRNNNGTG